IRALAKERRNGSLSSAKSLQQEVSALKTEEARAVAASFAAYFDLVNRAEENQRVLKLRRREDEAYPSPIPDSISHAQRTWNQQRANERPARQPLHRTGADRPPHRSAPPNCAL
ncbi:hypothetical protein JZU69_02695, partial [bacterium]|nr:hypothetical protein [bacterium]